MKKLTRMEFTVLLIIASILVIDVVCYFLYDFANDKGNIIFKLVFQGTISGLVTLGGLLFTALRQEQEKRIPFLVVQQRCTASARHKYSDTDREGCIECCDKGVDYVRKVNVSFINIKSNWVINCKICGTNIGSLGGSDSVNKYILISDACEKGNSFTVEFQDIFGKKYSQKIEYKKASECEYVFISNQPR